MSSNSAEMTYSSGILFKSTACSIKASNLPNFSSSTHSFNGEMYFEMNNAFLVSSEKGMRSKQSIACGIALDAWYNLHKSISVVFFFSNFLAKRSTSGNDFKCALRNESLKALSSENVSTTSCLSEIFSTETNGCFNHRYNTLFPIGDVHRLSKLYKENPPPLPFPAVSPNDLSPPPPLLGNTFNAFNAAASNRT